MKTRRFTLIGVVVLLAGLSGYLGWERYSPYIFPLDVCFTRNGVAVGNEADCRQASPGPHIFEGVMGGPSGEFPWETVEYNGQLADGCRQQCEKNRNCSFYVLRSVPRQGVVYLIGDPGNGLCILYR